MLETPGGQKVTLKDGPGTVDDRGLERQLGQAGARRHHVTASAKVTITAAHGRDLGLRC